MIYLNTKHYKKITEKCIWVAGPSRSGTTLLGKILGSCKDVEYAFEPETLYALLISLNKIKKDNWKIIYDTYLSEDIFFNIVNGRRISLKKQDYSFYLNYKSKKNLNNKLNLDLKRRDFDNLIKANNPKFVIKLPEITKYLPELQKIYPKNKFIIMNRNYRNTIISMVRRGWFKYNDKNISSKFPMQKYNKKIYPHWLDKKYFPSWTKFSEFEKAAIFIISERNYSKKIKNRIDMSYERILQNPKKQIMSLIGKLGLSPTKITKDLISQINIKKIDEKVDLKKLKIDSKIIAKLEENDC